MKKLTISMILFLFVITIYVKADEWPSEKTEFYYSENRTFMLKVIPTVYPENYRAWHSAKANEKKNFSKKDTTIINYCYGILYKTTANGNIIIWKKKLINEVCPVSAIVSNDGKSVITFDNWFSKGLGENVMVVYNELGNLKKSFQLEDISPFPITDYSRSISSVDWNCEKKFIDNERIGICFHNKKGDVINRIFNVQKLAFEHYI